MRYIQSILKRRRVTGPPAPLTDRIYSFDLSTTDAIFHDVNWGIVQDTNYNYYSVFFDDNTNKIYLLKYNGSMVFQSALCIGQDGEPQSDKGRIVCYGTDVFIVYRSISGGNDIQITKVNGTTMTVSLTKDYEYRIGSDYQIYLQSAMVVPDSGIITVGGSVTISGTDYGIIMKINVSDLTVDEAITKSTRDTEIYNIRYDGSTNYYAVGREMASFERFLIGYGTYSSLLTSSNFLIMNTSLNSTQHSYNDVDFDSGEVWIAGKFQDSSISSGQTFGIVGKFNAPPGPSISPLYGFEKTLDSSEKIIFTGIRFSGDYCYCIGYTIDATNDSKGIVVKFDTTGSPWTLDAVKHIEYTAGDTDNNLKLLSLQELQGKFLATGTYDITLPAIESKYITFIIDPVANDDLTSTPAGFTYNDVTSDYSINLTLTITGGIGTASAETDRTSNIIVSNRTWSGGGATDSGSTQTYSLS